MDSHSPKLHQRLPVGVPKNPADTPRALHVCLPQVPAGNVLLLLAHNGPEGLGSEPHSICGVDWKPEAGDWGDPDLAAVLQQLREQGRRVDLILHGHMHHMIKGEDLKILVEHGVWAFPAHAALCSA